MSSGTTASQDEAGSDSGRSVRAALAASLALIVATGLLTGGAFPPWIRAVLALVLCVSLVIAATRLGDSLLARLGKVSVLAKVVAVWAAVASLAFVPIPSPLLPWLSPLSAEGFPGAAAAPVSLSTYATLDAWLTWMIAGGALILAATVGGAYRRRLPITRIGVVALLCVEVLALAHAGLGLTTPLGLPGLVSAQQAPWLGPLVNPQHLATILLMGLPLSFVTILRRSTRNLLWPALASVSVLLGLALLVAAESVGAWISLAMVSGLWLWRARRSWIERGLMIGAAALLLAAGLAVLQLINIEPFLRGSVQERWTLWQTAGAVWAQSPILGFGPGGLSEAIRPSQAPLGVMRIDHLHNDPVEFVMELGVLGTTLLAGAAVWALWPRQPSKAHDVLSRPAAITMGLTGAILHSIVDFPLHIPGVVVPAAVLLGFRLSAFGSRERTSSAATRRALIGVATLLAVVAALGAVQQIARSQIALVAELPSDPASLDRAASLIAWTSPRSPWADLARLRAHRLRGEQARGLEQAELMLTHRAADAEPLRLAGRELHAMQELDLAERVLARAAERHSGDFRIPAARSLVATDQGDHARALDLWEQAVVLWPPAAYRRGQPFERALSLMPVGVYWIDLMDRHQVHPALYLYLSRALLDRGEGEEALIAANAAIMRRPDYRMYPELGLALSATGQTAQAEEHLRRALHGPSPDQAMLYLARLLGEQDRHAEALELWSQIVARTPGDPEAQRGLLVAAYQAEGLDGLRSVLTRLRTGDRLSARAALRAAQLATQERDWALCIDLAAQAERSATTDTLREQAAATLQRCSEACQACPVPRRSPK